MRKSARSNEASVNLTPMLDIVFIMLIFFIVTAAFTKEDALNLNLPGPGPQDPVEAENLVISIDASNQVFVGRRMVDIRSVRANIEQWSVPNQAGALIIRPDPVSHTALLVNIYDLAQLANVTNIAIAETN